MHAAHDEVELLDLLRKGIGQVVLLVRVIGDMIEFERSLFLYRDTLPWPIEESALLARKFPIEIAMTGVDVLSKEKGRNIDTICIGGYGIGRACEAGQRGHEVGEIDKVVDLTNGYTVWLVDNEGYTDTSFV